MPRPKNKILKKNVHGAVRERLFFDFMKIASKRHGPKHGWKGKGLSEAIILYIEKYGDK